MFLFQLFVQHLYPVIHLNYNILYFRRIIAKRVLYFGKGVEQTAETENTVNEERFVGLNYRRFHPMNGKSFTVPYI